MARSKLEEELEFQMRVTKLPPYVTEHQFHETKGWRFDFAWPEKMFAVEVEGIVWNGKGRHQTGAGFEADLIKYQAAQELGWTVYRCSGGMVKSGNALRHIELMLGIRDINESTSY